MTLEEVCLRVQDLIALHPTATSYIFREDKKIQTARKYVTHRNLLCRWKNVVQLHQNCRLVFITANFWYEAKAVDTGFELIEHTGTFTQFKLVEVPKPTEPKCFLDVWTQNILKENPDAIRPVSSR